jgi:hypothetical protein
MLSNFDEAGIAVTLEEAGAGDVPLDDIQCLSYGKPDGSGNDAVRLLANDHLIDLLKQNRIGRCIHITGKMHALADAFHRSVCTEIRSRTEHKFTLISDIPEESRKTPEGVARWNATKWEHSTWVDRMSAFNIIGDDIVDLYAYDTKNKIQYSVFGDEYVLLQSKHSDGASAENSGEKQLKKVWLLESETLNKVLCKKAEEMTEKAEVVPDTLFTEFSGSVYGVTSREIMRRLLSAGGQVSREKILDDKLRYLDANVDKHFSALKAIGFVSCDGMGNLSITPDGRDYIGRTQPKRSAN